MRRILLPLLVACSLFGHRPLFAQVDTTWREFYPLHEGDEWQYRNEINTLYWSRVVIAETLVAGHHYAALGVPPDYRYGYGFTRIDSLGRVLTLVRPSDAEPYEEFIYWLGRAPGTIWPLSKDIAVTLYPRWFMRYDGIFQILLFGRMVDVMRFTPGACRADGTDSIWYNVLWLLARGIGVVREQTTEFQDLTIAGAIIQGVQYGTMVSVADHSGRPVPVGFALDQNYPNPFNPSTTIRYSLAHRTHVVLEVFNTLGQRVAVVFSGVTEAGYHEVKFDASSLTSGVYCYRLRAGEYVTTKRMTVLK